ncbi:MAG: PilZ domain-containing protein, partial [Acidimicrobiales bacterium]
VVGDTRWPKTSGPGVTSQGARMQHQLRRLLPRQRADWKGRFLVESDPERHWHDCRIIDISSAGAGLELIGTAPEETDGQYILLTINLRARVRNARPWKGGRLRVGTEFIDLSEEESTYLASLRDLQAHW